jgi:filamentous hemagglutinin family protein
MKKYFRLGFRQTVLIVPISVYFLTVPVSPGNAQVKPVADATMVTPSQVNSIDALSDRIDNGVRRGSNLFHSFQSFDIDIGRSVLFTNPVGISNIFSRVTGGLPSNINGNLGVEGTANLFLINPKGIIFGKDAVLNLQGSFTASTATGVVFPNGERFSTTSPDVPTLLTVDVAAPIGLQFEGTPIGNITNAGKLSTGQDLTISAGILDFQQDSLLSGGRSVTLSTPNNIQLSTPKPVTIETPKIILNAGGFVNLGRIQNKSLAPLSINIQSQGDINFVNGIKEINGGSIIATSKQGNIADSGNLNTLGSRTSSGGTVSLTAKGNLNLGDIVTQGGNIILKSDEGNVITRELKSEFILPSGQLINGGMIEITALKGSILTTDLTSQAGGPAAAGNGGDIILNAYENISTGQLESLSAVTYEGGENPRSGNGGNVTLISETGRIETGFIKTASYFNSENMGVRPNSVGNAGNITLKAAGDILIRTINKNSGSIETYAYSSQESLDGSTGKAGSVTVETLNGSFPINTEDGLPKILTFSSDGTGGSVDLKIRNDLILPYISTTGKSGSGNVSIKSEGNVTLSDGLFVTTDTFGSGRGGDIEITSKSLTIDKGGQISSSTHANGNGGNIVVITSQFVQLTGVSTENKSSQLLFNSNGVVSGAISKDKYRGGYLTTGNTIEKPNPPFPSGIFSQTTKNSQGEAGNISITSPEVRILDQARVTTTTFGAKPSGSITVVTNGGSISLENQGTIATGVGIDPLIELDITKPLSISSGDSKEIKLQSRSLKVLGNSSIRTQTVTESTSGNIDIQADFILLRNNSQISTSSGIAGTLINSGKKLGQGGNICINVNCPAPGAPIPFNSKARGFIVALPLENSDITANAFNGNGGNIGINVLNFFGLKTRSRQELEILLGTNDPEKLDPAQLRSSEITAISQGNPLLNGNITQGPIVDPIQGVNQLPIEPRNTEVADNCQVVSGRESVQFFDIGRGGIPPRPDDLLSLDLLEWMPSAQINPQANFSLSTDTKVDRVDIVFSDRASPSIATIRLRPPCQSQ